jgi:uncharacterized protein YcbX
VADVVGRVEALWRFPVKSFQGERCDHLDVGPTGVSGDRVHGVIDQRTGHLLSAKREPMLFEAFARTEPEGVVCTLPDGSEHLADDPAVSVVLSEWLGRPVRMARPGGEASYDMTFDPPDDDAEVYEIPTPPDTFLDLAALHVLTTASVRRCADARPDIAWDVRRFRPNVLVDHDGDGFPEDDWVGRQVAVGGVVFEGLMRTMRCAMPLRAQPALAAVGSPALPREDGVYRTMAELHSNDLGLYATVAQAGTIRVGDPLRLAD